jgi:hypothetical protein
MVELRFGQTVTLVKRRRSGSQDDYGDDIVDETAVLVPGCAIAPGNTLGDTQGTTSALADVIVHMPLGTDVQLQDILRLPTDGREYWVNGVPQEWASPFTGTRALIEVRAVVTTGGPQAS